MYLIIDTSSYYEPLLFYTFLTYIVCILVLEFMTQIRCYLRHHLSINKPLN